MNIVDRVMAMAGELMRDEASDAKPAQLTLEITWRAHGEEASRYRAEICGLHTAGNGSDPDGAIRRLDARLTEALQARVGRAQARIDRAVEAMKGDA